MRNLFRKKRKSPGEILLFILQCFFACILFKYFIWPLIDLPDMFNQVKSVGHAVNVIIDSNPYLPEKPEDVKKKKEKYEQERINADKRYQEQVDEMMQEEHPDPVIKDIEKKLIRKNVLTEEEIKNLENKRQQRINQIMEERKNNIINTYNQNNTVIQPQRIVPNDAGEIYQNPNRVNSSENTEQPAAQTSPNKDSFISIIK
jgi:hypothetical protein